MNISNRSTRNSLLVLLIATGVSVSVFVPMAISAAPAEGTPGPAAKPADRDGKGLEHNMEVMGETIQQLQAQINDKAQNAASIKLVARLERETLAAKEEVPGKVRRMEGADKDKSVGEYRTMMIGLLRQELELEEHLIAGDNAKAAEVLTAMEELEKQGHTEFRPKRQRREGGRGPGPATRPGN